MTDKLTPQVAAVEFNQWAESLEISTDTSGLNEEDLKAFNSFKSKFSTRAVKGRLAINQDGSLTFNPRGVDTELTFKEPTGDVLSARLKNDSDDQAARRVLAAWTGAPAPTFAKMALNEFNFCVELLGFFANS